MKYLELQNVWNCEIALVSGLELDGEQLKYFSATQVCSEIMGFRYSNHRHFFNLVLYSDTQGVKTLHV